MKAIELEPTGRQAFRIRRGARTAEGAGGAKARVVNQDDQNVWGPGRRTQLGNFGVFVFWILGVVQHQAGSWRIRDRENGSWNIVLVTHGGLPLFETLKVYAGMNRN